MNDRKQKVEALLGDLQSLKRAMAFRMAGSAQMPRITPSLWGVLMFVEQRGKSTVRDVAKALHITSSAATQLIDGLTESGYVMREMQANDRRVVELTLSQKTKTRVGNMKKQALQRFLKFFAVLNDREFGQNLMLTEKIVKGFLSNV